MGKVILVGAGAGDTGLLTIKGKKYIEEADCIIYDRLASPELLGMAKHDCECIYVGKENHNQMVRNENAMQSIQEAYQLFESEGFDIGFSIMLSKVLRADIDEVSKLLSDFSNYRGIAVIPNYLPTKRLKDYQKYRCTQEECKGFISFLNEHHIETKKFFEEMIEC